LIERTDRCDEDRLRQPVRARSPVPTGIPPPHQRDASVTGAIRFAARAPSPKREELPLFEMLDRHHVSFIANH
jgi:hypothetical protein